MSGSIGLVEIVVTPGSLDLLIARTKTMLLSSDLFPSYIIIEILFGAEEVVDLWRRDGFQKFHAVFLANVEQIFFQPEFVLVPTIHNESLTDFVAIESINRPEFLSFLRRQVEPVGYEADLHSFKIPCPRSLLWLAL